MEITLVSPSSLRVKGKTVTFAVNPTAGKKVGCDAALFFERAQSFDVLVLEGNKLVIDGAGEYEIGGIKITGIRQSQVNCYEMTIDGVFLFNVCASALNKMKDIKEGEVVTIEADTMVNPGAIASLNASVLIFYGEQAQENVKALGKADVQPVVKYSVMRDKLPTETQILLLA